MYKKMRQIIRELMTSGDWMNPKHYEDLEAKGDVDYKTHHPDELKGNDWEFGDLKPENVEYIIETIIQSRIPEAQGDLEDLMDKIKQKFHTISPSEMNQEQLAFMYKLLMIIVDAYNL